MRPPAGPRRAAAIGGSTTTRAAPPIGRRSRCVAARAAGALAALWALGGARPAHAQQWIYGSNTTGIYRINSSTGAGTLLYSGGVFGGEYVAALAQRPSDGMIFFIYGSSGNDDVYRWDPATPTTAPVLLGSTGAAVDYLPRLAFDMSGNLYGVDQGTDHLYLISQTTGAATAVGAALTGGPTGNTGGDFAAHPTTGYLYLLTNNNTQYRLYRFTSAGGALTNVGTVTGLPGNPSGAAFNAAGTLFAQSSSSNNLYTVPLAGGAATLVGNAGAALQDLATVPVALPTASLAFAPATVGQNGASVLTITLTDPAPVQQRGAAFTLNYPANLVNTATPAGATTCGGTVTAAVGGTSVALTGGTIPAGGSCTVTVNVASATVGTYTATLAAGALSTVIGAATAAATATLTVIPRADLQLTKTDSVAAVIRGSTVRYIIVARNLGPSAVSGATVTDVFPAAETGVTWICAASAGSSCPASGSGNISASVNLAVNGTATFRATATASGTGQLVNSATGTPPAGVDDPPANSTGVDTTLILVYGVSVTPNGGDTVPRLPSTVTTGRYSYTYTLTNTTNWPESFDLLATAGTPGAYLTIDSITGAGVTRGARADSARLATIAAGATASIAVWYRAGAGTTGALDTVYLLGRSVVLPATARDSGWSLTRLVRPALALAKSVSPSGTLLPGTDVTYTITATNSGTDPAVSVVAVDSIAPQLRFRVGSAAASLPAGVGVTIAYSSDGGSTWTYAPASGGCSAPAGYDGCVNRVRWTLLNPLSNVAPNNVATLTFIARVR